MPERLWLPRRVDAAAARQRLTRYGAQRLEPAWLSLWALGVGHERAAAPGAWLIAGEQTPRALLWPGALPASRPGPAEDVMLDGGAPPTMSRFERWWLWERLARPRRWSSRVRPETLTAVWLPLWLGYREGRQVRLIVLSGVSGEPLVALKPPVLAALRDSAVPDG